MTNSPKSKNMQFTKMQGRKKEQNFIQKRNPLVARLYTNYKMLILKIKYSIKLRLKYSA